MRWRHPQTDYKQSYLFPSRARQQLPRPLFLFNIAEVMLRRRITFSLKDTIAVLRSIPLFIALAFAGCTTSASTGPEKQFVPADPSKYKTEAEKQRALQIAQIDCKTKAMSASAALEKSVASENHSRENLDKAREKGAEMYASTFTLCLLNAGYTQK